MRERYTRLFILALIIATVASCVHVVDQHGTAINYSGLIDEQLQIIRLQADVEYLCNPDLEGRDVPGRTGDLTALWIAEQFLRIGMHPGVGDSSYLQKVPLLQAWLDTASTKLIVSDREYIWGDGFYIFPKKIVHWQTGTSASTSIQMGASDSTSVQMGASDSTPACIESEMVRCGWGFVDRPSGRNDFADANDRAAVVFPGSDLPPEQAGRYALTPFKAAAAKRAGADMLIVAYQDHLEEISRKSSEIRHPLVDLPDSDPEFPTVYLNDDLLQDNDENIQLNVVFRDRCESHGFNVIGRIDGTIDEYVVIGAHYDHLGTVEGDEDGDGVYFPGADDNASGVAGLLEICRWWMDYGSNERGLIAISFTAEEDGLLGSHWLTDHLPVPHDKIVAMVNMDMIGRDAFASMRDVRRPGAVPDERYVGIFYSAQSPELSDLIHTDDFPLTMDIFPINRFPFSDAGSFHNKHIPTVHLFSGYHCDYSSPRDTPDKLNYQKMARIVSLTQNILVRLAEHKEHIGFDPTIRATSPGMRY
ncbi:MAG: M20/M25/M40 family metallo-hydrolase [Candidatus Electryoneaceae bacterium]|nr:M20/M25/M40 family metallo-hydrolase [Candidatus Electryoneaceae bacterium]